MGNLNIEKIVGMKLNQMNTILATKAYKRGVTFKKVSDKYFYMEHGKKSYRVRNGKIISSVNTRLAAKLVARKEVLSRLLESGDFRCPKNVAFKPGEQELAWNWAKNNLPVVLKPARGKQGQYVYVNIRDKSEFSRLFKRIGKKYDRILIEEFIEGPEYRFTYIYNELVGIAQRIPANVVGDGRQTIDKLIDEKNIRRATIPKHKAISKNKESIRVLERQGLTLSSVPSDGERVYLRNNSNVSTGGDAIDMTDVISNDIKNEVTEAVKFINGLRISGVDVIINNGVSYILEINTEPMLSMHVYPWEGKSRNLFDKALNKMFPNTISE